MMQRSCKVYIVAATVLVLSFVAAWDVWTMFPALVLGLIPIPLPLQDFLFPIVLWFYYLIPAIFVVGPVWYFGRQHVQWMWTDYAILILPFASWVSLIYIGSQGKSLSNVFVEPVYIGFGVPLAPLVRVMMKDRVNEKRLSLGLLAILVAASAAVYFSVPLLAE